MDNNNKSSNSFSVFLLGVIVGAVVVFLLVTKKGKRILKIISEKGLDNISNALEGMDKTTNLDEVFEEEEEEIVPQRKAIVKEVIRERPKTRRFFRGISRHVN